MAEPDTSEPTSPERRRNVVVAGYHGDVETVLAHRHDPDPHVRAASIGAMDRLDGLDDAGLVAALHDLSPIVIRRAITAAAGRHASPEHDLIDAVLVRIVRGDDADLAELGAWALGERWEETAEDVDVEVVIAIESVARDHADALVREAAVAALGSIGAARSLPVILAAAGDKATVRRRAVIALAPFDGPEVDAALNAARTDRDWQVRQAAEDLLAPPRPSP